LGRLPGALDPTASGWGDGLVRLGPRTPATNVRTRVGLTRRTSKPSMRSAAADPKETDGG